MARIELDQLAHSYFKAPKGPEDYALRNIHTTWDDGGAYALLGPSGCGKTTMLNIISGLLTPSHGRVLYDGRDVTTLRPEQRNIAQVFQFPVLYDTMTVYDNLAFPLRNRKLPADQVDKRVREVAEILDLASVFNKRAANLSADAKQKISLGRGLVRSDVAAILFDEPLTVIDPHLKWQLRRKLKEIHQRFGLTMIYVTHDQVEAMTFADKVVIMFEGEIVQIGSPQDLFENPEHTFVGYFIGSPGMNILPVELDGSTAVSGASRIPLDPVLAKAGAEAGGTLEVGIRPTYLALSDQAADGATQGTVTAVEDQGSCRVISLRMNGCALKARIPGDMPAPSGDVWIGFPPDKTKLFSNGRRIG